MDKTICELFAGVGGFRVGMERLNTSWKTVWFSQWEPGASIQWAHKCYVSHFGDLPDKNNEYHTGEDISTVNKKNIPNHTLLVGGFTCQDYSVAHSLANSKGIEGKIAFPDSWDKPSRTMLTSESTLNRSTHVVNDISTNNLRVLTPIEAERLQGFDDNWTSIMPEMMRYFCMGNAHVVDMVSRMGATLDIIIEDESK